MVVSVANASDVEVSTTVGVIVTVDTIVVPGGILMIMGLSPPMRVDASIVDVGSTVMVWVVMAVFVTSTRGKTF
jgi:hypothetical protein